MKFDIYHRTRYDYAAPVRDSFNDVRLQPMPIPEQTVENFLLRVLPAARLTHFKDFYSNWIHHFEIPEAHNYLLIEAQSRVITHPAAPLPATGEVCSFIQMREAPNIERCFDYLQPSRYVEISPEAWKLAIDAAHDFEDAWLATLAVMKFVHGFLKYESNSTHVHTHMNEVLKTQRGVCQDFAHLMLGLCRALKIPARYVSGYLATETANATHAWVEVFIPGHGWRGLDPTHNCQIGETYVKLGNGRDYADITPINGHYRGTLERKMTVEVKITPLS
ncbi:MAG TPA: transglutaminase family protein [Verrucomicrobiae bacterium]|jgi:transglutaminase-like putative cysteine protease